MIKIFISNDFKKLASINPQYSVEAEFGENVVEGSIMTLAHHGDRAGNPCPCLGDNLSTPPMEGTIVVSHFDLDTLGGVLRILGRKPQAPSFWGAASKVDVMGVHKLGDILNGNNVIADQLNAFWAWSEKNKLFPPRGGEMEEVTEFFKTAGEVINGILRGDDRLIEAGKTWSKNKEALDEASYVEGEVVILRQSSEFVNHLYRKGKAVVAFNSKWGSITVSLADPVRGVSCRKVVQTLWGPEAGGHDGIAGSPRGQKMTMEDAREASVVLKEKLNNVLTGRLCSCGSGYNWMYCPDERGYCG